MPATRGSPPVVTGPAEDAPTPSAVHEAILAVMADMGSVSKDGFNESQKYSFRSIDDMVAALQPALISHGVTIVPRIEHTHSEDRPGRDGRVLRFSTVIINFAISAGGETIVASMAGEAFDSADKAMNKAVSAATKYFLFYTFWPPVGREDADSYHFESETQRPAAQRPAQASRPAAQPQRQQQPLRDRVASRRPEAQRPTGELLSEPQGRNLYRLWHHVLGWDKERYLEEIEMTIGRQVTDDRSLTAAEARQMISQLKRHAGEEDNSTFSGSGQSPDDGDPGPEEPPWADEPF